MSPLLELLRPHQSASDATFHNPKVAGANPAPATTAPATKVTAVQGLGDRTAFDAAFLIREGGSTTLIGIETKYHEYAAVVPVLRLRRGVEERREPKDRYLEVTKAAGLFLDADWIDRVWGHDVEQVWRDHLLAHAWSQASKVTSEALYVVVAPAC